MNSIVISILLGLTSNLDGINANKVSINTFSKSETMAKLLSSAELDLSEYAEPKEDDEESDDEKERDQSHVEINTEQMELAKHHGRDRNGMFKNHKNFVRMRNKINDQEQKHQRMFDTINKKLTDDNFIAQASAMTAQQGVGNPIISWEHLENQAINGHNNVRIRDISVADCKTRCNDEEKFECHSIDYNKEDSVCDLSTEKKGDPGVKMVYKEKYDHYIPKRDERAADAKLSTKALMGMTEADEACYKARYSDIGDMDAREHFEKTGHDQGRLGTCAPSLTTIEEQTYLDRYPDLQHAFGRNGTYAQAKAHNHMLDYGFKEKRSATPDYGVPIFCADKETTTCKCPGTVWLGLKNRLDTGARISTWEEFRTWKTMNKTDPSSFIQCSKREFGINKPEYKGIETQCWCERFPAYIPNICANEGEECLCNGRILFGERYAKGQHSGKEVNSIISVTTNSWTVNSANQTGQHTCNSSLFEDVDPLPGVEKRCFCDQKMTKISYALEQRVKEYWRQKRRELELREEKIRAEALAEEAAKKAVEQRKAEEERIERETKEREAKAKQDKLDAEEAKKKSDTKHKADLLAAANAKIKKLEEAKKQAQEADRLQKEHNEALKEETQARLDAEAEKDHDKKMALIAKMTAAKNKAIKAAVDAAIAEANSKARQEEAAREEEEDKNRLAQEKATNDLLAAQRAAADSAAEAAEKAHKAEMEARINAEAQARSALLKRHHAELEKQIANALEKQKDAFEAKNEEEAKERKFEKDEADKQAAEALAQQQKEQEAAEAERKKAEDDEKATALAEIAEAKKLADKKIEAEQAKLALQKKKFKHAMEIKKAKEDLLQAQKEEELAKTNDEVQAAQQKQAAAQKAAEDAENERKKADQERQDIEDDIVAQEAKANAAKEAAALAKNATLVAKENAANWKKVAEAAKLKAAKEMAEAEAAEKAQKAELLKEQQDNKKKHDEALAAQNAAFKAAEDQAKEAQKAAAAARKAQSVKQLALEKKLMTERKAGFNKLYSHTWAQGPTGISQFQFVVPEKSKGNALIAKLFEKRLIADVEIFEQPIKRSYTQDAKVNFVGGDFRLVGVTTDERVPDLIAEVVKNEANGTYPHTDIMVYALATGSKDYILWVKDVTQNPIGNDRFEFEDSSVNDAKPDTGAPDHINSTADSNSTSSANSTESDSGAASTGSDTSGNAGDKAPSHSQDKASAADASSDNKAAESDEAPAESQNLQTNSHHSHRVHHKKKHHHHKHRHQAEQ